MPCTVDLADRAAVDRILGELLDKLSSAAMSLSITRAWRCLRPLAQTDDDLLDWLFAVNFTAAFRITRTLLPALRASGRGAVVNIASELALVGQPDYSAYCATKGAVLAWSRALAVELAADGIRVNAVCPGPVDTAMLQGGIHNPRRSARGADRGDRDDSARAAGRAGGYCRGRWVSRERCGGFRYRRRLVRRWR